MRPSTLILIFYLLSIVYSEDYKQGGADWTAGSCATGQMQSPIDIVRSYLVADSDLKYQVIFKDSIDAKIAVEADGTIKSAVTTIDTFMASNHQDKLYGYTAANFHFHAPSEHTVDGVHYDLELHIVQSHDPKSSSDVPSRSKAVIGFLFKVEDSKPANAFLTSLSLNTVNSVEQDIMLNIKTDLWSKITLPLQFYQYDGSLTTGTCDEIVNWYLVSQILTITSAQLNYFTARYAGNNAFANGKGNNRNVQPLNGRVVKLGTTHNILPLSTSDDSLSGGAIAGIVIGSVAFVAIIMASYCKIQQKKRQVVKNNKNNNQVKENNKDLESKGNEESKKDTHQVGSPNAYE